MIWLQSRRKMMSALMSSANPDPKHNPAERSLKTSGPCSVATRGLSMLLMNGGIAHANRNTPKKRLALRFRSALSCPGVRSESFGTPRAYRADQLIARVTRNTRRVVFKGRRVDCAMLIKVYRAAPEGERKYPRLRRSRWRWSRSPEPALGCRRLTRLTNAFNRKADSRHYPKRSDCFTSGRRCKLSRKELYATIPPPVRPGW